MNTCSANFLFYNLKHTLAHARKLFLSSSIAKVMNIERAVESLKQSINRSTEDILYIIYHG